jgi:hypothetical protein
MIFENKITYVDVNVIFPTQSHEVGGLTSIQKKA